MNIKNRLVNFLFASTIERAVAAAVSIRIDDSPGWDSLTQAGPADRPWAKRYQDLDDALDAWRKNFLVRRITTLVRSYVVGPGLTISSEHKAVESFIRAFWDHPKNRIARRLGPMCDELTRAGEIFPTLFTNRVDGMSYVRLVPASQIRQLETDEADYEIELRYGETQKLTAEVKWWLSPNHPAANTLAKDKSLPPVMLHFTVNKPVGATRGEGDLGPLLPWAKRYSEWLKDRVRLNRQRTRQGILGIKIADHDMVDEKRKQLQTHNPMEHGIYVYGPGEDLSLLGLNIRADDAKEDGRVLRLACATGGNTALHYLGEGESANYATAKEMGEPTARFYTDRQQELSWSLCDLIEAAYRRKVAMGLATLPRGGDFKFVVTTPEVARADNQALATAAAQIVEALMSMRLAGWIDDKTAVTMAFKFAGEALGEDEILRILSQAKAEAQPEDQEPQLQEEDTP